MDRNRRVLQPKRNDPFDGEDLVDVESFVINTEEDEEDLMDDDDEQSIRQEHGGNKFLETDEEEEVNMEEGDEEREYRVKLFYDLPQTHVWHKEPAIRPL